MNGRIARLAQKPVLRKVASSSSAVSELVARYVAGHDVGELMPVLQSLTSKGLLVSVAYLGDRVSDLEQAAANERVYLDIVRRLGEDELVSGAELSLRFSRLGQRLGAEANQFALDSARRICRAANNAGVHVTVDMSDSASADAVLQNWGKLQQDFPATGITLQSALYRTHQDLHDLALPKHRIRICKGGYREDKKIAFRDPHEIDLAFVRDLRSLLGTQAEALIATHDPRMIAVAEELIRRTGRAPDSFEFQMLYGIRPWEQRRLADIGYRSRVLVPFGPGWYDYYTERLAERPAGLALFARSLIRKR